MTIKRLVIDALLIALVYVLAIVSINITVTRITFESIPVILSAFLLGPIDACIVGFFGNLLYQVTSYGFDITTLLWVLPYVVCGLLVGVLSKKKTQKEITILTIVGEIIITTLNTIVMYIDAKIKGYYTFSYVFGNIFIRYFIGIIKAGVISLLMKQLVDRLNKFVK